MSERNHTARGMNERLAIINIIENISTQPIIKICHQHSIISKYLLSNTIQNNIIYFLKKYTPSKKK